MIGLAAGAQEFGFAFDGDFFQRLQAVGREAGTEYVNAVDAAFAKGGQGRRGVGLQPLGTAEARLEADLILPAG